MEPCWTNVTQLHFTSLKPVNCKFNFGVNEPLVGHFSSKTIFSVKCRKGSKTNYRFQFFRIISKLNGKVINFLSVYPQVIFNHIWIGLFYTDYEVTAVNLEYDSDLATSTTTRYITFSRDFQNVVSFLHSIFKK